VFQLLWSLVPRLAFPFYSCPEEQHADDEADSHQCGNEGFGHQFCDQSIHGQEILAEGQFGLIVDNVHHQKPPCNCADLVLFFLIGERRLYPGSRNINGRLNHRCTYLDGGGRHTHGGIGNGNNRTSLKQEDR